MRTGLRVETETTQSRVRLEPEVLRIVRSPNVALASLLYFNTLFSAVFLLLLAVGLWKKSSEGALSPELALGLPVALSLWALLEPARIAFGRYGNREEQVAELAAFYLLTVFPQLPLVLLLAAGQPRRRSLDAALGALQIAFMLGELAVGIQSLRRAIAARKVEFYAEVRRAAEEDSAAAEAVAAPGASADPLPGRDEALWRDRAPAGPRPQPSPAAAAEPISPAHEPAGLPGLARSRFGRHSSRAPGGGYARLPTADPAAATLPPPLFGDGDGDGDDREGGSATVRAGDSLPGALAHGARRAGSRGRIDGGGGGGADADADGRAASGLRAALRRRRHGGRGRAALEGTGLLDRASAGNEEQEEEEEEAKAEAEAEAEDDRGAGIGRRGDDAERGAGARDGPGARAASSRAGAGRLGQSSGGGLSLRERLALRRQQRGRGGGE